MTYTHIANQSLHVLAIKHIAGKTNVFALMDFTIRLGDDSRGILTAMLQDCQRIIEAHINTRRSGNSYNTTHRLDPTHYEIFDGRRRFHTPICKALKYWNQRRRLPPGVLIDR